MNNILVINSGSTSIKYKLFDSNEQELAEGCVEHVQDYDNVIKQILRQIINFGEIDIVAHRVVHGGGVYFKPLLLNEQSIADLEKFNYLAPLHNPHNLAGAKAVLSYMPGVKQFAVFDNAFYEHLPETARTYGLPKKIYEQYKIYRYGFHGLSHEYAMNEAVKSLKIKKEKINLISCHLGGGCTITAIKAGKAVDVSTGFTPTEGLLMMTRSGDLDPSIIIELIKKMPGEINAEKVEAVNNLINKQSGVLGVSDGINDFQELVKQSSLGQRDAKLAFDIFVYRLVKYIGAYFSVLGGKVDALIFTGSIGSGQPVTRDAIIRQVSFLKLKNLIVVSNEELMIARAVMNLAK